MKLALVFAAGAAPALAQHLAWGCATQKPDRLFLHVFDWPASGTLVVPMRSGATAAYLLVAPDKPLAFEPSAEGLRIRVPATRPDAIASVVVLEGVGRVEPLPSPPPR